MGLAGAVQSWLKKATSSAAGVQAALIRSTVFIWPGLCADVSASTQKELHLHGHASDSRAQCHAHWHDHAGYNNYHNAASSLSLILDRDLLVEVIRLKSVR